MKTAFQSVPAAPASVSLLRIHLLEARNEFLRLLRYPMFAIPTLTFPLMFYLMFGVLLNRGHGEAARYLLATYSVFGIMGPALFGFGVTVAMERAQGTLQLKRALPMPPSAYLVSKLLMAMLFALIVGMLLLAAGMSLGGVALNASQVARLLLVDVLGTLPFCALGLWIGTLASGTAAPAIVNMIYLPLSVLSGLWVPMSMLPPVLREIAPLWPSWHLGEIALKIVGMDTGRPLVMHLGALAVFSAVCFFMAARRLARSG